MIKPEKAVKDKMRAVSLTAFPGFAVEENARNLIGGLSSFLCKFFRKNFMGRGTSPFVELAALKLHLIKAST